MHEYVSCGYLPPSTLRLITCSSSGYGSPEWSEWVLGEEEGIKHIKTAYDAGITSFE
jgi:hypothetical protein